MSRNRVLVLASAMLLIAGAIFFYRNNLASLRTAIGEPDKNIADVLPPSQPIPPDSNIPLAQQPGSDNPPPPRPAKNNTNMPLTLPDGFEISVLADGVGGARDLALDGKGGLWVSQPRLGQIMLLELKDGVVQKKSAVFKGLNNPHGLAFDPSDPFMLYIAEEHRISRARVYSEGAPQKIIDLPTGGNHNAHSLLFGADGKLYVKIGSTCNVCVEKDDRHGKIFSLNKDGSGWMEYARGLRNAPFLALHPATKKIWATEMGRDFLGDNLPPDEINIIEQGRNYGWPNCYGKNIHDVDFDRNTYVRSPCSESFEMPSYIDIPAHSAPLGLAFAPMWKGDYAHDLFVAYHGSWNRSKPTGYKVVRMKLDANGAYSGTEDFITGWLQGTNALGRPVDIVLDDSGLMFISDDKAAVIYRVNVQK